MQKQPLHLSHPGAGWTQVQAASSSQAPTCVIAVQQDPQQGQPLLSQPEPLPPQHAPQASLLLSAQLREGHSHRRLWLACCVCRGCPGPCSGRSAASLSLSCSAGLSPAAGLAADVAALQSAVQGGAGLLQGLSRVAGEGRLLEGSCNSTYIQ